MLLEKFHKDLSLPGGAELRQEITFAKIFYFMIFPCVTSEFEMFLL